MPSTFNFTGNLAETQVLTITATPLVNLTAAVAFGQVLLTEAGAVSPNERITVAIKGVPGASTPTPTPSIPPATPSPTASPTPPATPTPTATSIGDSYRLQPLHEHTDVTLPTPIPRQLHATPTATATPIASTLHHAKPDRDSYRHRNGYRQRRRPPLFHHRSLSQIWS